MIVAVALTLAYILSEGNSQICRTLFVLTRWIYTALDKQQLFNETLRRLERHRWLLQKGMTPVRTGSDMLLLKDIIQRLATASSITEWIRDAATFSLVCVDAYSLQSVQKTSLVNIS